MKTINDRYLLLKRLADKETVSHYVAKDNFKNKTVLLKIFDMYEGKPEIIKRHEAAWNIRHPNLIEYYNLEKIWMVDGNLTYSSYYVLISEYIIGNDLLAAAAKPGFSAEDCRRFLDLFWDLIFFLYGRKMYVYEFDPEKIFVTDGKALKMDMLDVEFSPVYDIAGFKRLVMNTAAFIERISADIFPDMGEYAGYLRKTGAGDIESLLDMMKADGLYGGERYSYIYRKKNWTSYEMGQSLHLEILKDLYSFQIKRNSKIAFMFLGSSRSFKNILIHDFLEFLKMEKYMKIEIVIQDFYDFLKYLFECIRHYGVNPDLSRMIERQFTLYTETLYEQYLLKVQNSLLEFLFEFSITKKIVLHVENVLGMDDRINRFINMMMHMQYNGNVILLFDAGMEKNRFNVFYKDPRFEIVTKEYLPLDASQTEAFLKGIIGKEYDMSALMEFLGRFDMNQPLSILGMVQKLFEKQLAYPGKDGAIRLDQAAIEENIDYLSRDDTLEKKLQFLRAEEMCILWYIAHSRKVCTLADLISLVKKGKDDVLGYLGSLRSHAYIDEIWENDQAYYRIVRDDIKDLVKTYDKVGSTDLVKEYVAFLEQESDDPTVLLTLVDLAMDGEKYPQALQYIDKLLSRYTLSRSDYLTLKTHLEKVFDYKESFGRLWLFRKSMLIILDHMNELEALWAFVERIFPEYVAGAENVESAELWYYLSTTYGRLKKLYKDSLKRIRKLRQLAAGGRIKTEGAFLSDYFDFLMEKGESKHLSALKLAKDTAHAMSPYKAKIRADAFSHLYTSGEYEDIESAIDAFIEELTVLSVDETSFVKTLISALVMKGNILLNVGDATKAKSAYTAALEAAASVNSPRDQIIAHNNIASSKYFIGFSADEIIQELNKSVSIGRHAGDLQSVVVPLANIAELHAESFRFKEAYSTVAEAMRYVGKYDKKKYLIVLKQAIGILVQMGDFKKSRYLCTLIRKTAREMNYWQYMQEYNASMGDIYYYWNKPAKALEYYDRMMSESETRGVYNYEYFDISLKKVDILFNHMGKKTQARDLFNRLKTLSADRQTDLGDINLEFHSIYFVRTDEEKIAILERLLSRYKREKKNRKIVDVLIELSKLYEKKQFNYRLYEVCTDILFYEQHIKNNFPKGYIRFHQKTHIHRNISERKKAIAEMLGVPSGKITFNFVRGLWQEEYSSNMARFYKKDMFALIEDWNYAYMNIGETIKNILKYILEFSKSDRVTLFLRDSSKRFVKVQEVTERQVFGDEEYRSDLLYTVIKSPGMMTIRDYSTFSSNIVKAAVFPMLDYGFAEEFEEEDLTETYLNDAVRGFLYMDTKKYCNNIKKELTEYIFPLVQHMGLLTRYKEIRDEIIICPLTGVFTRYYFLNAIEKKIAQRRKDETIGFIIADIDHMSDLNRKYGEIEGDGIIRKVAQIMRDNADPGDIIGRYLGEEFVVAVPRVTKKKLMEKAEQLLRILRQDAYLSDKNVSVSMGMSYVPDHGEKLEIVLSKGVSALNRAKKEGEGLIFWEEKYGLYRGKHDILAGIITGDIAMTEDIVRNLIELTMLEPSDVKSYFWTLHGMLSRFLEYEHLDFKIRVGTEEYEYRDPKIMTIAKYIDYAKRTKESLIAINWKYEEDMKGMNSDLLVAIEEEGIYLHIYFSSGIKKKEYTYVEANLLNILARLITGHLRHLRKSPGLTN